MEPYKVVLIIGNGFDLNLGLNTKYSDFANSDEWKEMIAKEADNSCHYSLLKYLNDRKSIDNWFDIEQALIDYAHINTKSVWPHDVETDKHEFHILCDCLIHYLENHINNTCCDISNTFAAKVLRCFQYNSELRKVYSFNYTPLDFIAHLLGILHPVPFIHVHGSIKERNIILGIETDKIEIIIPEYTFLIKTNNVSYQHTQMHHDMIDADEVIVFGHSMNMIDAVLFEDYLQDISDRTGASRRLTIVTYNESSQRTILQNIRMMGISVPKLFSHAQLEFIWTEEGEQKDLHQNRFDAMLNRIQI